MFQKTTHKRDHTHASQKQFWLRIGVGIALVFLIALTVWFVVGSQKDAPETSVNIPVSAGSEFQDPLTGLRVEQVHANQQVYGVMIDENRDARPQSGIDQAFLVIEAPVEAGIPRLLAFFSEDQSVEKIGPVRSARPYFIDWALEFDALYTHVGGSNEALEKIKNGATFDLNEFWNGPQFWRATDRLAPHNTYTSTELLRTFVEKKQTSGRTTSPLYGVWKFKAVASESVFPQRFSIRYLAPDYVFSWVYSVADKVYVRMEDDQPVKTKEGNEIHADNIAVVITEVEVLDAIGRRSVRTTGEGEAYVFQDGKKMQAVWKKPTASERLRFFTKEGSEIEMNPGKTWIEVIENNKQLVVQS
jgi:hypothetical protein